MRKIKALIYALLGTMVAWTYWQQGSVGIAVFIETFTLAMVALILSTIGRLRIQWDETGITLSAFLKKPKHIRWDELEKISQNHLGYHIRASSGQFNIRKKMMPEELLQRIKAHIRQNKDPDIESTTH